MGKYSWRIIFGLLWARIRFWNKTNCIVITRYDFVLLAINCFILAAIGLWLIVYALGIEEFMNGYCKQDVLIVPKKGK